MEKEEYREKISKRYLELKESHDQDLQDILLLASEICGTPVALITLLDKDKQYFKVRKGIDITETERHVAFCNHTVEGNELFTVNDATTDDRFSKNPLVTGYPNIQFYAGFPLQSPLGSNVGSLCVIDNQPRSLTSFQEKCLEILARQAIQRLELGASMQQLENNLEKLQKQKEDLDRSDNMLRAFFDSADEYQVLLDEDLKVVAINKAAKELFKQYRKKEPVQGESFIDCLSEQSVIDLQRVAPSILKGEAVSVERLLMNGTGEELWLKVGISPAFDKANQLIGLALVGSDINTQKLQEEKIQEQYNSLSKIAQWQSHKLRQPVSSILGITNLIQEENHVFREEYIASLRKVTEQLDEVIKEIVVESRSV
ncbi:sensor histidine kinase [Aridibaculum aurantiacum]|uniref:sensor histidine kinase n=1 Tax=Aridibaculum aurantiacum TaxID=2810307 RepID=UPI001A96E8EF|nr:sensor histidine kinase [Aridibaculum aurantiacum]